MHRPDSALQQLFGDLRRRHIQLGIALSPLSARPSPEAPECGVGIESYSAPGEALMIARKVKHGWAARSTITRWTSPFFLVTCTRKIRTIIPPAKKPGDATLSISEIAQDAAKRIKDVHSVFPDAKIGDVEPFMQLDDGQWEEELSQWFDAFQSATGQRLAYFRLDMWWNLPWQRRIGRLVNLLHSKQVPLQVIYDGASFAPSDRVWIDEAAQQLQRV